jgi:DNA-binding XRE family transcriptional regulator
MKKNKHAGPLVAQLRKTIGKSQTQFAAMIGVSKHTIISVENGRNQLSPKLAKRIQAATGAEILDVNIRFAPFGNNPRFVGGTRLSQAVLDFTRQRWDGTGKYDKIYTREDFEQWRKNFYSCNDKTARDQFGKIKIWIEYVFRAAVKPGPAGMRDRFPAVYQSLIDWLNETQELFKLMPAIDEILENETRDQGEVCMSIDSLLADPKEAKRKLDEYGYDFSTVKKIFKRRKTVFYSLTLVTESRQVWDPMDDNLTIPCSNRKVVTKPRYWLEDWRHFHKRVTGKDWSYGVEIDQMLKENGTKLPPVDPEIIT